MSRLSNITRAVAVMVDRIEAAVPAASDHLYLTVSASYSASYAQDGSGAVGVQVSEYAGSEQYRRTLIDQIAEVLGATVGEYGITARLYGTYSTFTYRVEGAATLHVALYTAVETSAEVVA